MNTVDRIMELADKMRQASVTNFQASDEWRDALLAELQELADNEARNLQTLEANRKTIDAYQVAADKLAGEIKDMQRQEPVAWADDAAIQGRVGNVCRTSAKRYWEKSDWVDKKNAELHKHPLYAAPQPAQPVPPHECKTEAEKLAYAAGWWKALEVNRAQPVAQPLPMTDEEYTHLTTAGAKAWAGVNARELREGGPVAQPLTDDQIETAYRELYRNEAFGQTTYEMVEAGIRYAEKHHGIGAKEHGTP